MKLRLIDIELSHQSKHVLLIGGGGAICVNACHFEKHAPPFTQSCETCAQNHFFSVELMECFETGRTKEATAQVDLPEPGCLHPPLT